jgi:hypothetical protein
MPHGCDGADHRSSSGSPSPLRSPAAALMGLRRPVSDARRHSRGTLGALAPYGRGGSSKTEKRHDL